MARVLGLTLGKVSGMVLVIILAWPAIGQEVTTLANVRASGDIAVADNGDVYVADFGNPQLANGTTVVKITPDGQSSIFASGLPNAVAGVDFDSNGNLIQSSFGGGVLNSIAPDGTVTRLAGGNGPVGLVVDNNDGVFVAGCNQNAILQLTGTGVLAIFARSNFFGCPNGITVGHDGALYVVNFGNNIVNRVGLDGAVSLFATTPGGGNSHIEFANNTYYLTGRTTHTIYAVDISGEVTVIAGTGVDGNDDGPAGEATLSRPNGLGVSPDGRFLYVAGTSNFTAPTVPIRRIDLRPQESDFQVNAGVAGAWANLDTLGQGLLMDVTDTGGSGPMFVAWFTYDTNPLAAAEDGSFGSPQHRWFTAQGEFSDATATLTLFFSNGGIFDDPTVTSTTAVGTMSIVFSSCTSGTVSYQFDTGQTGQFDIERLTPDQFCLAMSGS